LRALTAGGSQGRLFFSATLLQQWNGTISVLLSYSETGLPFAPFGCIAIRGAHMPITTLKVLSTVLQLHGQDVTVQSDHQGINALLNDLRGQNVEATQVYFRRGGFIRGGGYGGGFRRAGYGGGGFRRGGFVRY
jgi:hypothetical protein